MIIKLKTKVPVVVNAEDAVTATAYLVVTRQGYNGNEYSIDIEYHYKDTTSSFNEYSPIGFPTTKYLTTEQVNAITSGMTYSSTTKSGRDAEEAEKVAFALLNEFPKFGLSSTMWEVV
jgi:hypothetical protein